MRYLLDTNTCIAYLNGREPRVRDRLAALRPEDVALCSVVKAELLYGARKSAMSERTLEKLARFFDPFHSLPFDDRAAEEYGGIRAQLERSGELIGPNDLMIAAIARAHGLALVTHKRVSGLELEDWHVGTGTAK